MDLLSHRELGELLCRAKDGDKEAFTEIYRATAQLQYYKIKTYVNNAQDAEDILQAVYLYLWEKLGDIEKPRALISYLNSITVHTCLYHKEKERYRASEPLDEKLLLNREAGEGRTDAIEQRENRVLVSDLLKNLTQRERMIVVMRYVQSYKIAEIADELQISVSTVKRDLQSAMGKMRKKLPVPACVPFLSTVYVGKEIRREIGANSQPRKKISVRHAAKCAVFILGVFTLSSVVVRSAPVKIQNIEAQGEYSREALPVKVTIAPGVWAEKVVIVDEDGTEYPMVKTASRVYACNIEENGYYRIKAVGSSGKADEKALKINRIDREVPEITRLEYADGRLVVGVSDKGAGIRKINLLSNCKEVQNGQISNTRSAKVIFRVKPGAYRIRIEDRAGNIREEPLRIVEKEKSYFESLR